MAGELNLDWLELEPTGDNTFLDRAKARDKVGYCVFGKVVDGIDVALIKTDGENIVERGPAETFAYSPEQQAALRQGLTDALTIENRTQRPRGLAELETKITDWHISAVKKFIKASALKPSHIDIIGFHGQTVLHRPEQRLTVQLGDGAALSKALGIAVAYDMRAADVAAGGQGAGPCPPCQSGCRSCATLRTSTSASSDGRSSVVSRKRHSCCSTE